MKGSEHMTLTDAQKQARYEQIKAAAVRNGESVNGYIKKAIDERIERNSL